MKGQESLFNLSENKLDLISEVKKDEITEKISNAFDYQWDGITKETIQIPSFPSEFDIGLIVGSSGSGKSTILKEKFGKEKNIEWDNEKCIASHFQNYEDASKKFGAVGLNSIPTWLKPYKVLSNGEKFRADMARKLENYATIDEFTSVVNREVAISCSMSIEKYIRKNGMHNIVFCSCHDDIIPYLHPDWIYNTDTHEFYNGRYLLRPQIVIKFHHCKREAWDMFKRYHYLSADLNPTSLCFIGEYNEIPIIFVSFLPLPGRDVKHAWRGHRFVVLPDYQGMGIGTKTTDMFAQAFIEKGCRYFDKESNPRIGEYRDNSPLWRATVNNHKARTDYIKKDSTARISKYSMSAEKMEFHSHRICYSHEYVGNGTKYPYTFEIEDGNSNIDDIQLSLF